MLTRDQILGAGPLAIVEVEVPEWGGSVYVSEMDGRQRDAWEQSVLDMTGDVPKQDLRDFRAKLAVATVTDADRNPVFMSSDIELVTKLSSVALDRVFEVARKINKISNTDIEELSGNS